MQYVGRLVSSVYNSITPNINPATLSGAIDVIVVERPIEVEEDVTDDDDDEAQRHDDAGNSPPTAAAAGAAAAVEGGAAATGAKRKKKRRRMTTELASTPFHVRFGKMSVLRPAERKVTLHLNNNPEPLPYAMKVGSAGEAFFVLELDDDDSRGDIPDDLVTSPILSATTSPVLEGGASGEARRDGQGAVVQGDAAVEPFDLGASETAPPERTSTSPAVARGAVEADALEVHSTAATVRSVSTDVTNATADTAITTPSERSPVAEDRARPKADVAAPDDAAAETSHQRSGSGDADGGGGLLSKIGNAASEASGAIGAAGRSIVGAVPGSSTSRLEKAAQRQQRAAVHDRGPEGEPAPLTEGEAGKDAPRHQSHEGEAHAQEMLQEDGKADEGAHAQSETERLEKAMKQKSELMLRREEIKEDLASPDAGGHHRGPERSTSKSENMMEKAYPAPFGEEVASKNLDKQRVGIASKEDLIKLQRPDAGFVPAERAPSPTLSRGAGRTARLQADVEGGRAMDEKTREELRYMLDIDGYKMTEDGERIAFAEGQRLSHEMPLSRRHGGSGSHGHREIISKPHRHPRQLEHLMRGSAEWNGDASHAEASGASTPRRRASFGGESPEASDAGSMHLMPRRTTAAAATAAAAAAVAAASREEGRADADELSLSRDLVRLTRLMRPLGGLEEDATQELFATETKDGAEGVGGGARSRPNRRQRQEVSLSDTEAEFTSSWRNSSARHARLPRHLRATSADTELPADDATRAAGDGTPPRYDGAGRAQSPDLEWGWGELPKERVRPEMEARARVVSTAAASTQAADLARGIDLERGDLRGADSAEADALTGSDASRGKLTASADDPYVLRLELDDAQHEFQLSLCHTEGFGRSEGDDGREADTYRFEENRISFQRFLEDADVVNDERLVVLYRERFLTWENASAVLATLSLYRKTLSMAQTDEEANEAAASAAARRARRGTGARPSVWSRWWNRGKAVENGAAADGTAEAVAASAASRRTSARPSTAGGETTVSEEQRASEVARLAERAAAAAGDLEPPLSAALERRPKKQQPASPTKFYAKTLRLTSDQLKSLNLKKGANTITFSVTSSYSGVATCSARIFLWESTHKIVVSDIDGTITKSDALGHVFTMIGRDWTHMGVAKLYTDVARNGYRIMYLTSRAIGQADITRDYLRGIKQGGYSLPDGPVIMSPDRLMASLHREVILRKPEVFKMACLRDIARLFGIDPRTAQPQPGGQWPGSKSADEASRGDADAAPSSQVRSAPSRVGGGPDGEAASQPPTPFYAGFGNRITDALSYRSVNIPSSRIFTIDHNGEVKMELLELAGYKSSYIHMTDLVDQMFPPITMRSEKAELQPEFNDFNFWRPDIPEVELPPDDELVPTPPPTSPALSARSIRSLRSVRSNGSVRSGDEGGAQSAGNASSFGGPGGGVGGGVGGGGSGAGAAPSGAAAAASTSRLSRFGLGSLGLSRKGSAQTIAGPTLGGAGGTEGGGKPLVPSSSSPDMVQDARSAVESAMLASQTSTSQSFPSAATVPRAYTRARSDPAEAAAAMATAAAGGEALASSPPSSYGSGVTSWTAAWRRRRAVSPGSGAGTTTGGTQATSPLVGPVITAEPDEEEEEDDEDDDDADETHGAASRRRPRRRAMSDDDVSSFGGHDGLDEGEGAGEAESEWDEEDEGPYDDDDEVDGDGIAAAGAARSSPGGDARSMDEQGASGARSRVAQGGGARSSAVRTRSNDGRGRHEAKGGSSSGPGPTLAETGDDAMLEEEDELLQAGEIRFEWNR